MEKYYAFAGVEIAVELPPGCGSDDDRTLAPFAVEKVTDPHRFRFQLREELDGPTGACIAEEGAFRVYGDKDVTLRYIGSVRSGWESAYARVENRGKEHTVQLKASQFPQKIGAKTVLNCLAAEHLTAQNGGFVFHSSYIEWEGKAILFTAPSGTGKSTQAELWHRLRGAAIRNGDRSAVRFVGEIPCACGIPFAGSSNICENVTLPLKTVVYLKQAPSTAIRRLRGAEAFRSVWEGCSVNTWDRADVEAVSNAVMKVITAVPVYELACTPDGSAVAALEGVLTE